MPDMPIVDLSANEPAPPSKFGKTAQNLLESVVPINSNSVIAAATAYALLDLADAIRN